MRYDAFAQRLERELPGWVAAGLVRADQAEALRARYSLGPVDRRRSRAVGAVATVGAIAAGLGVILFFAANWDAISRPLRVLVLLVALLGSYAGGLLALERRPAVGPALLVLGSLAFGAGIFLVGQMYHVQAHDPLAFALWSAGVAPLAAIVRSRSLATVSLLTLGAWIGYETVDLTEGWETALLAGPLAVSLYGAGLYGLGTGLGSRTFGGPMRGVGYALATAGAFVLSFELLHREAGGELHGRMLVLVGVLAAVTLGGSVAVAVTRRATATWEALALIVVAGSGLATALGAASPLAAAALFNGLLLALALGAVVAGYLAEELWLATSGLAGVTVLVTARFLDFTWEFLPRSAGFVGAGLLLLALAFALERGRARLAAGMGR